MNDTSSAIRVCFDSDQNKDDLMIVTLVFDEDCQVIARSVKFAWGDQERAESQWRAAEQYDLDDDDIEQVKRTMSGFNRAVGINLFVRFEEEEQKPDDRQVRDQKGESASQRAPKRKENRS